MGVGEGGCLYFGKTLLKLLNRSGAVLQPACGLCSGGVHVFIYS